MLPIDMRMPRRPQMPSNHPERSMSRRRFLHSMISGAGAALVAQLLAACGDDTTADTPTVAPAAGATRVPAANASVDATTTLKLMMGEGEFSDDQIKVFTDTHTGIKVERVQP